MKIVIIGGTGYTGSRLFLHLIKLGHSIDTVDLEWFGNFVNPKNIKVDFDHLGQNFWNQYDAAVLLAGHSSVPMCIEHMKESFDNNVAKFINLLPKVSKLIYASSSSIYGNTGGIPAFEDWDRFNPSNYYDLTKKVIDLYAQSYGGKVYGLRMGTVNGASLNLRVDIMINKMYDDAKTLGQITIFNSEVYRPILGIDDFCRAVACLIEGDAKPGPYNLASFNANINQISQMVAESVGNVEIINKGSKPTYDFSIDTGKFKKAFDFEFKETTYSIIDSLKNTYDTSNKGIRICK